MSKEDGLRAILTFLEVIKMNNKYTIVVGSPLLRPGLTIETEVSENYVVPVLRKLFEIIREFNSEEEQQRGRRGSSSSEDEGSV